MAMTVAELFVNLGVKGATQLGKTLGGVQEGLQKTAEMSWKAKAGIFAAVVGLEEMTRFAVGTAIDLKNFSGATGLSTDSLQRWGYVAKMNNVSFDELAGTIRGLQSAQAKMALGQGAPAGALFFGLDPNKNPLELFDQIAKKIRATANDAKSIGIAREMAGTLGISENMFAMFRTGQMGMGGLRKEMILTTEEQQKLLALDREWSGFWMTLKGTGQKTIANEFAGPISYFVKTLRGDVIEAGALMRDLEKSFKHVDSKHLEMALKGIGAVLLLALAPIAPYTAALVALAAVLDDLHKYREGKESNIGTLKTGIQKEGLWGFLMGGEEKPGEKKTPEQIKREQDEYRANFGQMMSGVGSFLVGGNKEVAGNTVTVTNHITVDGAQHPRAVADEIQRKTAQTYFKKATSAVTR